MINAILQGIMSLIMGLVSLLLSPIDMLIEQFLPDLSGAINAIGNLFAMVSGSLGFCISLLGLSSATLSLIVLFYTFKLTVPLLVSSIKTAIKWYNALKP